MRTLAVSGLSGSEVARIARAVRYAYRSVIRAFDGTFNLDPAILGKQIIVDELPVTVVGVTPRGFSCVQVESSQEIWLPLAGMLSPPMVVVGVGIGTPLAFWVKSFASTLIQDLPVGSLIPMIMGAIGIVIVTLLASHIPARHAAKVDPIVALRCE